MVSFAFKTLLSLVPKSQRPLVTDIKNGPLQRSIDDITIPFLRPNNIPQPITVSDRERFDITALVFIKSRGKLHYPLPRSVREANPWRSSRPFWNSTNIKYILWSKYLNEVTLREAKQIIAREVCDKLYSYIYLAKEPIIGIKIVLYNGTTDTVVSPRILRDPWFDNEGFNNLQIDRRLLRSWGLKTGYIERVTEFDRSRQALSVKPPEPELDIKNLNARNLAERLEALGIDLDNVLRSCLISAEENLSIIEDRRAQYRIRSKLRALLAGTRFKTLFSNFLVKKLANSRFKRDFTQADNKQNFVEAIANQIIRDFIDKEYKK